MKRPPDWQPLGRIVEPLGGPLSCTHAMLPTPLLLRDRLRVFFSACDASLRGRVFFADLAVQFPHRVLNIEEQPVFDLGARGTFDCDGVNPLQVLREGNRLLMFYVGWQRDTADVPYTLITGLAESWDEGLSFHRLRAPVLPPSDAERIFRTAAYAFREEGRWRLVYVAGSNFIESSERRLPIYSLKQTFSDSLERWPDAGEELLAPDIGGGELGYGRPVVWEEEGDIVMLVSKRTRSGYELLTAPLADIRKGIAPTVPVLTHAKEPWESEMTCFGTPLRLQGRDLLFYNGNGFGKSGFGLAWRSSTEAGFVAPSG